IAAATVWVRAQETIRQLVVGPAGVIVTNEEGKPALTMQSLPNAGRISVFNRTGQPDTQRVAAGAGGSARLRNFQAGGTEKQSARVGVGGKSGAIRLTGDCEGAFTQVSAGGVGIRSESSPDPVVVIRDDGGGLVRLRSSAGASAVMLSNADGNGLIH